MKQDLRDKILKQIELIRDEILDLKEERNSHGEWIDIDANNEIAFSIYLLEYETKVLFKLLEE